jgi:predicted ATPase
MPSESSTPASTPPLVGRERELAQLEQALEDLEDAAAPRFVEISGEAGIGKTRLLDELCRRGELRQYLVFRGQAVEFERNVPFAPVIDALDAYLATLDPGRLKLPEGELRDELGGIFPSLRTDRSPVSGVHDERYRAYRAVRELLERLAGPRPLVIAVDDLQCADDASAELIAALLAKPPPGPVMLALAGRSGLAPEPLEASLGAVERRGGVHRLRLGPLSEQDAEEMLSHRLDPHLRRRVYEVGGGNPFYMEQLARMAGTSEPPVRGGLELPELELPPAISAALAEEIRALPGDRRELLQAAAVAGDRF